MVQSSIIRTATAKDEKILASRLLAIEYKIVWIAKIKGKSESDPASRPSVTGLSTRMSHAQMRLSCV
jgi:hypothetical protein